jgi:hypothetical protein
MQIWLFYLVIKSELGCCKRASGSRRIADAKATGEPHGSMLGVPLAFGGIQGKAAISSSVWHEPRSFLPLGSVKAPALLLATCGWLRKSLPNAHPRQ